MRQIKERAAARTPSQLVLLGFTSDDIVTAEQDARLAQMCVTLCDASEPRSDLEVRQTLGEGDHIIWWYVSAPLASLLDSHDTVWRRFLISKRVCPPPNAKSALRRPT